MRPALCEDALRLGRVLAELAPARAGGARPGRADGDPGLARRAPASTPAGEPILLLDQNRGRWDQLLIRPRPRCARARREARRRARALRAAGGDRRLPRARTHERTRRTGRASPRLYDALAAGRAIAGRGAEPRGRRRHGLRPAAGARARRRAGRPSPPWRTTTCCPAVRGDLLSKLGRLDDASSDFEHAASLARNTRERELLLERAAACARGERPVR